MSPRAGLDTAAVVQAAAALVDAEGMEALSITRLARTLGVKAPSLYNHIGGLPGLRRELALLSLRQIRERITTAAICCTGPEALVKIAQAYRDYIKASPGVYSAGLRASGTQEVVDEEIRQAEEQVLNIVMTIIQSLGLYGSDAIHAARGLRSLVHGFATLEVSGGFGLPLDLDESFQRLVQMLVLGMQQQSKQSKSTSPPPAPER